MRVKVECIIRLPQSEVYLSGEIEKVVGLEQAEHTAEIVIVTLDVVPTDEERKAALVEAHDGSGIDRTDDEEWICEEVAMARLDKVEGVEDQTILDTEEPHRQVRLPPVNLNDILERSHELERGQETQGGQ